MNGHPFELQVLRGRAAGPHRPTEIRQFRDWLFEQVAAARDGAAVPAS